MKIKINDNNISITDFCKSISVNRTIFINYLLNNKYIYVQYYGTNKDRRKNISFPKYDTENGIGLFEMNKNPNTIEVREQLLSLSGVGPKVADCILLFSTLKRFEAFPIDVWVRRVMNDLYFKSQDENKLSKTQIEKLAQEKFGNLAGLAQQYLFYWRREQA